MVWNIHGMHHIHNDTLMHYTYRTYWHIYLPITKDAVGMSATTLTDFVEGIGGTTGACLGEARYIRVSGI